MAILLQNANFVHWDTLVFQPADVLVEEGPGGRITLGSPGGIAAGEHDVIDCRGKLVTRSFAVAHHHVYSALARGMPPPPSPPAGFLDILRSIWWRLDKSLDADSIRMSALVTAMAAAKSGATFVADHHASPHHIRGSLDIIAGSFEQVGIAHLLCYEVSDRDGSHSTALGLEETDSYLQGKQGLVGLHASFTVGNDTLKKAVELMQRHDSGIHMHLAEDTCDQEHCLDNYNSRVVQRLDGAGVLDSSKTIMVHGLHLDDDERKLLGNKPCWVAQNMESNLKNKVGRFNARGLGSRIMLGTDGMHSDMLRSCRAAFLAGQGVDQIDPVSAYARLRNIHRYLKQNGFAGDDDNNLVVLAYDSPTELNSDNLPAHMVFGMHAGNVRDVIAGGRLIVKNRVLQTIDEETVLKESAAQSRRLWNKMQAVGVP